ncbi:MAG: efflux RND transporter periplasmic adaptor subunit, partial [Pseudomonadota bacterium]
VSAGDVLTQINGELLGIQVAQAEADLAVAEAAAGTARIAVGNAQTAYARAETLRASSVIADAAYEDRRSALSVSEGASVEAEARVAAAKVALRRAQYDLNNAVVRAPFDGVVIDVATEQGQFVAQGSEIARLIDTSDMEVEAAVPARFVGALRPDLSVDALTDAGGQMQLRLRAALPTEFSSTRTRPVIFDVVSTAQPLAAGQSVTLQVPISEPRSVIAVPKDALTQGRDGWQVFVSADGVAQPRTVELGAAIGDRFEVTSGLALGDVVVVRGNERLRPGQAINPTSVDAPSEADTGQPEVREDATLRNAPLNATQDTDSPSAG